MDKLQQCAKSFEKLFEFDYKIKAGKNKKTIEFTIFFLAEHFYHLIGLQYLEDLPQITNGKVSKKNVFHDIIKGNLTYDDIKTSHYIKEVDDRILYFHQLENLVFNKIIIKFDKRKAYSSINATVLLFNLEEKIYTHLFLTPFNNKKDLLVPRSFFTSTNDRNVIHQERYTVFDRKKEPRKGKK